MRCVVEGKDFSEPDFFRHGRLFIHGDPNDAEAHDMIEGRSVFRDKDGNWQRLPVVGPNYIPAFLNEAK